MSVDINIRPYAIYSPVELGQKLYSIGHGNRKTPIEWEVVYIGVSCVTFDIHLVRYECGTFIESRSIPGTRLGVDYFSSAEEVLEIMNDKKQ